MVACVSAHEDPPAPSTSVLDDREAEVPGKLIERPVDVGDRVKPGQVVARLDPRDFQNALDRRGWEGCLALLERRAAAVRVS